MLKRKGLRNADVIVINTVPAKPAATPKIIRTPGVGALDLEQLAAVLARLLEL